VGLPSDLEISTVAGQPPPASPLRLSAERPRRAAKRKRGRRDRAPLYVCVKVGDPKGVEATSGDSEWKTTLELRAGDSPQTASSPFPDRPLVFEIPGDARENGLLVFTLFEVDGRAETLVARGRFPLASPPYRGLIALRRGPESPARPRLPITGVTWWEQRQEEAALRISLEIDFQVLPHRPQKRPRSPEQRASDRIMMSRDNPDQITAEARKRAEKAYQQVLEKCDFTRSFRDGQDLADISELRRKIRKVEHQIERTQKEIEHLEGEIQTLEAEGQADD
jgi:hypothetical protein